MKHQHSDININVEFDREDVEDVVDKVTDSVITIIVVATAAHILRKWIT